MKKYAILALLLCSFAGTVYPVLYDDDKVNQISQAVFDRNFDFLKNLSYEERLHAYEFATRLGNKFEDLIQQLEPGINPEDRIAKRGYFETLEILKERGWDRPAPR